VTGQLRRRVRRHHPARAVVLWLAAMAAVCVLALAEYVVARAVVFVPLAAAAAGVAYAAGRAHGSRRPFRRDRARRLAESQRLGQLADLEQLAGRSVEAMIASYRVIARRHQGGRS
jgi:hypothetical protein